MDAEKIRQQVIRRYRQRLGFLIHVAAYIGGNLFFWGLWAKIQVGIIPPSSRSDHTLWPLIVMLMWGIVLLMHGLALIFLPRFQESQERAIARDTEAALARYGLSDEKPKRGAIRLSDDGELITDDEDMPKRKMSELAE
jgi:hypothetical protein